MDREKCKALLIKMASFEPYSEELCANAAEDLLNKLQKYGWDNVFPALWELRISMQRMPALSEIQEEMGQLEDWTYANWYANQLRMLVMRTLKKCGALRPWQE